MSRRPRIWNMGQELERMAPGGALWSESPVRRPLPRVRRAGVPAPPVSVTVTPRGTGFMLGGGLMGMMSWGFTPAAGDKLVVTALGIGPTALTPPAGWTVLATGTLNGHKWVTAWGTYTSGDVVFTNGGAACSGVGSGYVSTGTPTLVAAPITTGPGAMSVLLPNVSAATLGVQDVVWVTDTGSGGVRSPVPSPPDTVTDQGTNDSMSLGANGGAVQGTKPAGLPSSQVTGPYPANPAYLTFDKGCTVVSIGWGWT